MRQLTQFYSFEHTINGFVNNALNQLPGLQPFGMGMDPHLKGKSFSIYGWNDLIINNYNNWIWIKSQ